MASRAGGWRLAAGGWRAWACAPGEHYDRRGRTARLRRAPGDRNNRSAATRRIPWHNVAACRIAGGPSAHPVHTVVAPGRAGSLRATPGRAGPGVASQIRSSQTRCRS